jgi:hypothetical protein
MNERLLFLAEHSDKKYMELNLRSIIGSLAREGENKGFDMSVASMFLDDVDVAAGSSPKTQKTKVRFQYAGRKPIVTAFSIALLAAAGIGGWYANRHIGNPGGQVVEGLVVEKGKLEMQLKDTQTKLDAQKDYAQLKAKLKEMEGHEKSAVAKAGELEDKLNKALVDVEHFQERAKLLEAEKKQIAEAKAGQLAKKYQSQIESRDKQIATLTNKVGNMVPKANVDAMKKGHEQKLAAEVKKRHDESTSYEELVTSLRQRLEEAKSKPAEPDKFAELNKKLEDAYSQRDKANNLVGNYKSQLELADSDVKRIRKEKTELKTQFDTLEAKLAEKDKMLADEKQKREEAEKAAKVPPQVPVVQKPVQQPKGKPKIPKFFVEMPKDEKPAEEEQKEKPEIPKFFIDMP